jgi:DNA-binding GntR family transcriptional regulator
MLPPVDKRSLSVEVANTIRSSILNGRIKPGEKLLEQELSLQMNTSRGPIRDAFIRLEHEGLVVREPNRSVTVVDMTKEDVEEIHSIRLTLELLALRYLCSDRVCVDVSILRDAVEKLRAGIAQDESLDSVVDSDLAFHEELVRASGHSRLYKLWLSIKPQIGFLIFTRNAHNVLNFNGGADQHEALMNAVVAKDYPTCERILNDHLLSVLNYLLESFREEDSA